MMTELSGEFHFYPYLPFKAKIIRYLKATPDEKYHIICTSKRYSCTKYRVTKRTGGVDVNIHIVLN
jgi:hypothetical protein